jgi:lipopolysaccharide biosynthesis glycosyltransferase
MKRILECDYPYPEQCLINELYKEHITEIPYCYNNFIYKEPIEKK